MSRAANSSRGQDLALRLFEGCREADRALRPGARRLPVLHGVTPQCTFTLPQENVLADAGQILIDSQRIYHYGDNIVIECVHDGEKKIETLATARRPEPKALAALSNIFLCETVNPKNETPPIQFPPPSRLVDLLLNHEPTAMRAPRIEVYSTRPLFDPDFRFCGPGYHEDMGYLVHGPDVEPTVPADVTTSDFLIDRLPRRLRELDPPPG